MLVLGAGVVESEWDCCKAEVVPPTSSRLLDRDVRSFRIILLGRRLDISSPSDAQLMMVLDPQHGAKHSETHFWYKFSIKLGGD